MAQASNNISVNVMCGQSNCRVSISRNATVNDLVQLVIDREGLNIAGGCPGCTTIHFSGKQIHGPLQNNGVKNGSVCWLVSRVLGGGLANVWYKNGALNVGGVRQRQTYESIPEFTIPTFHVSCKSDKIEGKNMMGVVLYLCDNKQLFYLNGMKCRSGYVLLVSAEKLNNVYTKDGTMHSKAFKHFCGQDLRDTNIVGGGFAIRNGQPIFRSGTFNSATTKFHDGNREMHIMEKQCIEAAINNWKRGIQNTNVSDVCGNGSCFHHGFY